MGIFACRTPHRPNQLGQSLARIISVDKKKGEIVLQGLDCINGTPVIDIKPYLPQFESIPDAAVPHWVQESADVPRIPVCWAGRVEGALSAVYGGKKSGNNLRPYASIADLQKAVENTLSLDIRSPFQQKKHQGVEFTGDLNFHKSKFVYTLSAAKDRVTIVELRALGR